MKLKFLFSTLILSLLMSFSHAQMKVVMMGSSTTYGTGASTYDSSWVGRITSYLNQNNADGLDTTVYNIAMPGYDTYQEMPTTFVPPPGRPIPDEAYNATMAVSLNPDVVIVSLPSNDISFGYSKAEFINNLRVIVSTISNNGIRCYVTTPQPRNDFTTAERDSLVAMIDSINTTFGPWAVDFWSPLVTQDGTNALRDEYRAIPNPIHLNDAGHGVLFRVIRDGQIFEMAGPVALRLTNFQAVQQSNSVLIKWQTEQQEANTGFVLEKSADGRTFQTAFTQTIPEARASSNYTTTDQTPFAGKTFYRLKVIEGQRQTYSNIISVNGPGKALDITKLYADNSGSNLNVEISIQKSQLININIISVSGAIIIQKKESINQPGSRITIPIGTLASGQYYVRIYAADGTNTVKAFTK